jgi:EmrB/QacA subfamily drug resistance transporter
VALIVAVAWFMQNLDTTIIITSLPQIARTFGVPAVDVNLGITANVAAGAAFIPLGGWLADRFGTRRVFAAAIAVFGLASVGSAAAPNLAMFVVARAAQGAGGALMVPVGRIVVLRNTNPAELLRATALITYPGLIAPVIAPVLGGALTTWLGWPAIFLVNVPIAVVGVVLVLAFIPDEPEYQTRPLDKVGALLVIVALGTSIYGLSGLSQTGSRGIILVILALGVTVSATALWWLRRAEHPLVDLAPLKVATFTMTTASAGNVIRLAICAVPFVLPLMLQQAWDFSPLQAANVLLVYAFGNLATKIVTTPLLRRLGFRTVLVVNGVAVAATIAGCGLLTSTTGHVAVLAVAFAAGATRSLQFTAMNTLAFADIDPQHRSAASTIFSMAQQISMALGVAAAAATLSLAQGGSGHPTQASYTTAFGLMGLLALGGALWMLRLHRQAGDSVTGGSAAASVAGQGLDQ